MENKDKRFDSQRDRRNFSSRKNDSFRKNWSPKGRPFASRERQNDDGEESKKDFRSRNFQSNDTKSFEGRRENGERRGNFERKNNFVNRGGRENFNKEKTNGFQRGERRQFSSRREWNHDGQNNDKTRHSFFDDSRQPQGSDGEQTERKNDFRSNRGFQKRRFNGEHSQSRFTRIERPTEFRSIDKAIISKNFDDEWGDDIVVMDSVPQREEIEVNRPATEAEGYRINRYISNAGVCSRRAADDYIAAGRITLNGSVVKDFSTKVFPNDVVCLDGKKLSLQKRVYIVFNKPKDCISTKYDELGRKTIFDYVQTDVEVKNVGRLDRSTTGVMLLTNDGDLIDRLTHPRYNKMKIYHVFLNKNLSMSDFESIRAGVQLDSLQSEDGQEIPGAFIDVDDLQYVDGQKNQVGIQIHSGLYHVVRRIFEKFGYEVEKLDRVYFAGLTKKDLPRGHWRYLTQKEISILKRGAYE